MTLAQTTDRVRVRAPGKINLFLQVGPLGLDGYHPLATAFQAVSLYEDVVATDAEDFTLAVTGDVDLSGVPIDDRNLAIRAARLLAAETGYTGGVHLDIAKQVPVAGGMGGGSADAAATLVACDALWETHVGHAELHRMAARLGADVPFALTGGTAIGRGRGDQLSPALARGTFHWVLVPSNRGLSTPAVYAELDAHRERHRDEIGALHLRPEVDPAVLLALRAGDAAMLAAAIANDLQPAALRLAPELADLLQDGESHGALAGIVSGSGPTVAFLVESEAEAAPLIARFADRGPAIHVTAPVPGARLV